MRIFVAVVLDAALRAAIAELRPRLNSAASSLRWVPPQNLHFTLKFLGEIPEERVARVGRATREVAARTAPFSITLTGMGAFPSPARPQVVWVGVEEGSERLVMLADDLGTVLHRMKFPKEPRAFRPHLTVARMRHSGSAGELTGALRGLSRAAVGTQMVEVLRVVESQLGPAGATYRVVDEVRLGEAA